MIFFFGLFKFFEAQKVHKYLSDSGVSCPRVDTDRHLFSYKLWRDIGWKYRRFPTSCIICFFYNRKHNIFTDKFNFYMFFGDLLKQFYVDVRMSIEM